nr:uncharacterized protein LOC123760101 isoform X1 [Procambarus clarkii]
MTARVVMLKDVSLTVAHQCYNFSCHQNRKYISLKMNEVSLVGWCDCRVSSVLGKNTRELGKQHLFDDSPETCWNSDQGTPQWVALRWKDPVLVTAITAQFQRFVKAPTGNSTSHAVSAGNECPTSHAAPADAEFPLTNRAASTGKECSASYAAPTDPEFHQQVVQPPLATNALHALLHPLMLNSHRQVVEHSPATNALQAVLHPLMLNSHQQVVEHPPATNARQTMLHPPMLNSHQQIIQPPLTI